MSASDRALGKVQVLHADDALLVLAKPAGLLSVPGRGPDKQDVLSSRVQALFADALVVHRLDMATSGLIVMARGPQAQRALSIAFAGRAVDKRYEAVVHGRWSLAADADGWGLIDLPIRLDWPRRPISVVDPVAGKPSQTRWRVIGHDPANDSTRLELAPLTGRSHQLRLHLAAQHHPILGDALYASPHVQGLAPRLLLHASVLELAHPTRGERLRFACPTPF